MILVLIILLLKVKWCRGAFAFLLLLVAFCFLLFWFLLFALKDLGANYKLSGARGAQHTEDFQG